MGQVLYRKYRSMSFGEVVGQEHITKTLENALKKGKLGHALLLTGPRGVGKTSVARILAHQVNGLSYEHESKHIDIIEIDAASNRRIDEIRELRDKARVLPALAKYKVYIIDEVHMLTREAFNALLKTLEEPPAHVIFILATTDMHKLPETIVSRTQVYNFKPIGEQQLKSQLGKIAKTENINITEDALEQIALHAGGSFRDALTILDQARFLADRVGAEHVRQLLGIASHEQVDTLIHHLASGDLSSLSQQLHDMREGGAEPTVVAKQLSRILRERLISNSLQLDRALALKLLNELVEVGASRDPQSKLEILVLSAASETSPAAAPLGALPPKPALKETPAAKNPVEKPDKATAQPKPARLVLASQKAAELWAHVLKELKQSKGMHYSVARMATPTLDGQTLYLDFEFGLHLERARQPQSSAAITQIIKDLTGKELKLVYRLAKKSTDYKPLKHNSPGIANISNIFGEAEVLES